jgi:hypothetical protein
MISYRIPFICALLFIAFSASSQVPGEGILKNMYGEAFSTKEYVDVIGYPFLYEEWQPGEIKILNENNSYKGLNLKYDLVKDVLLFKSESGEALLFAKVVTDFKIYADNKNPVHYVLLKDPKYGISGFYEVLSDGKAKLLKKPVKKIVEKSEYASANKIRNFESINTFFIQKNDVLIPVKKDKKSFLSVLADKQVQIEKYADENKLSFKNEEDLSKIINYYNGQS